ncbi:hypothetical protein LPJ61_000267 [Coemansia biformis]|uniref:PNK3P-domain-containing protein n=1 Tax=Coemansia biformis TaxID=1286918 RepID=A0A9W7YI78_9FUNG|nr:hypothetical protein LPJ61_000267 [Coemansia biformis]
MTRSSAKRCAPDDSPPSQPDRAARGGSKRVQQQQSLGEFFSTKRGRVDGQAVPPGNAVHWRSVGATWVGTWGAPEPAARLAAFDLDGTLICTKSKGRFPKGADDWRFFHPDVPLVLRRMCQQGYRIVVISNQNGLRQAKGTTGLSKKATDFRTKVANIARALGVPLTILVATDKDYMRKPSPGMWSLAQLLNEGAAIDRAASFYVGDAAGRPAGWRPGVEADFSSSDLAFALNVGVPFYTPEEAFAAAVCARPEPLPLPPPTQREIAGLAPSQRNGDPAAHAALLDAVDRHVGKAKEDARGLLAVLVGPPACGKSTFARSHLALRGFERVNMDELKTRKKCTEAVRRALEGSACVVVDNTNPDAASRSPFIELARASGAGCIAIVFSHEPRNLTMHNNSFRAQLAQARYLSSLGPGHTDLGGIPGCDDRVPEVAFHSFFKRLELPSVAEGFQEVICHSFVPTFDTADDERLWNQHY